MPFRDTVQLNYTSPGLDQALKQVDQLVAGVAKLQNVKNVAVNLKLETKGGLNDLLTIKSVDVKVNASGLDKITSEASKAAKSVKDLQTQLSKLGGGGSTTGPLSFDQLINQFFPQKSSQRIPTPNLTKARKAREDLLNVLSNEAKKINDEINLFAINAAKAQRDIKALELTRTPGVSVQNLKTSLDALRQRKKVIDNEITSATALITPGFVGGRTQAGVRNVALRKNIRDLTEEREKILEQSSITSQDLQKLNNTNISINQKEKELITNRKKVAQREQERIENINNSLNVRNNQKIEDEKVRIQQEQTANNLQAKAIQEQKRSFGTAIRNARFSAIQAGDFRTISEIEAGDPKTIARAITGNLKPSIQFNRDRALEESNKRGEARLAEAQRFGKFNLEKLKDPAVAQQITFGLVFGGALPAAGAAIGGAFGGATGALIGSTVTQAAQNLIAGPIEAFKLFAEEAKKLGLSLQGSIAGITAVRQANLELITPSGTPLGLSASLRANSAEALKIQTEARKKLLPLGIAGATESTFVQGIVSALSQRGLTGNAKQVSRIAELLGGAISTQRPQLLENTTLLLRDLQDVLGGGPLAKKTVLSQLIKPAFGAGLQEAKTIETVLAALEKGLSAFPEAAKNLDNPITLFRKLQGAIDNLQTQAGVKIIDALAPAFKKLFDVLSAPDVVQAAETIGTAFGELTAFILKGQADLIKFGASFTNNFAKPIAESIPTIIGFSAAIATLNVAVIAFNKTGFIVPILNKVGEGFVKIGEALTNRLVKEGVLTKTTAYFGTDILTKTALSGPGILAAIGPIVAAVATAGTIAIIALAVATYFENKKTEKLESDITRKAALAESIAKYEEQQRPEARFRSTFAKFGLGEELEKFVTERSLPPKSTIIGDLRDIRDEFTASGKITGDQAEAVAIQTERLSQERFSQREGARFLTSTPQGKLASLRARREELFGEENFRDLEVVAYKREQELAKALEDPAKAIKELRKLSGVNLNTALQEEQKAAAKEADFKVKKEKRVEAEFIAGKKSRTEAQIKVDEETYIEQRELEFATKKAKDATAKIRQDSVDLPETAGQLISTLKKKLIEANEAIEKKGNDLINELLETSSEIGQVAASEIAGIDQTSVFGRKRAGKVRAGAIKEQTKTLQEARGLANTENDIKALDALLSAKDLEQFNNELNDITTVSGKFQEELSGVFKGTPSGALLQAEADQKEAESNITGFTKKFEELNKKDTVSIERALSLRLKIEQEFIKSLTVINNQITALRDKLVLRVSTFDLRSGLGRTSAAIAEREELSKERTIKTEGIRKVEAEISRLKASGASPEKILNQEKVLKDLRDGLTGNTVQQNQADEKVAQAQAEAFRDQIKGLDLDTFFGREQANRFNATANVFDIQSTRNRIEQLRTSIGKGEDVRANTQSLQAEQTKLASQLQERNKIEREAINILQARKDAERQLLDAQESIARTLRNEIDQRNLLNISLKQANNALIEFRNQAELRRLGGQSGLLGLAQNYKQLTGQTPANLPGDVEAALGDPALAKNLQSRLLQEQISSANREYEGLGEKDQDEEAKLRANIIASTDALTDFDKSIRRAKEAFEELVARLSPLLTAFGSTNQVPATPLFANPAASQEPSPRLKSSGDYIFKNGKLMRNPNKPTELNIDSTTPDEDMFSKARKDLGGFLEGGSYQFSIPETQIPEDAGDFELPGGIVDVVMGGLFPSFPTQPEGDFGAGEGHGLSGLQSKLNLYQGMGALAGMNPLNIADQMDMAFREKEIQDQINKLQNSGVVGGTSFGNEPYFPGVRPIKGLLKKSQTQMGTLADPIEVPDEEQMIPTDIASLVDVTGNITSGSATKNFADRLKTQSGLLRKVIDSLKSKSIEAGGALDAGYQGINALDTDSGVDLARGAIADLAGSLTGPDAFTGLRSSFITAKEEISPKTEEQAAIEEASRKTFGKDSIYAKPEKTQEDKINEIITLLKSIENKVPEITLIRNNIEGGTRAALESSFP